MLTLTIHTNYCHLLLLLLSLKTGAHFTFPWRAEDWFDLGTAVSGAARAQGCISQWLVMINMTAHGLMWSHPPQSDMLPLDHGDLQCCCLWNCHVLCAGAVTSARIHQLHWGFNYILKVFVTAFSPITVTVWLNWMMLMLIVWCVSARHEICSC